MPVRSHFRTSSLFLNMAVRGLTQLRSSGQPLCLWSVQLAAPASQTPVTFSSQWCRTRTSFLLNIAVRGISNPLIMLPYWLSYKNPSATGRFTKLFYTKPMGGTGRYYKVGVKRSHFNDNYYTINKLCSISCDETSYGLILPKSTIPVNTK